MGVAGRRLCDGNGGAGGCVMKMAGQEAEERCCGVACRVDVQEG